MKKAKEAEAAAQTNVGAAQTALKDATAQADKDKAALEEAQKAGDAARATVKGWENKIAQWQQFLVDEKDTSSSEHLNNLKKGIAAMKVRLGQAQAAVDEAQAALDSANEALTNAKNTLADTEKKNADFKDALANTQAIKDYEAASATLAEYQKELASAQDAVAKAEAAFNEAQQKKMQLKQLMKQLKKHT